MSGSGSSSSELGGGTPALAPPPAESISAKNDDSRSRHPRRACGCCLSLCSTVSCAFCCGPVILAWMVVRIASCSARCGRSTTRCCCSLTTQPLDRIASYFGEGIAFYFAWLEFYTQWLLAPAIVGTLLFIGQVYFGSIDIAYAPLFSLFIAIWSILLLEMWKRRNAELAQRWGVLNFEDEEVVRPQFQGEWLQDARTGEILRLYPAWRRRAKHAVTVPLFLILLVSVAILMVCVFATRDSLLMQIEASHSAALIYRSAMEYRAALLANASSVAVEAAGSLVLPSPPVQVEIGDAIRTAWSGGFMGLLQSGIYTASVPLQSAINASATLLPLLAAESAYVSGGLSSDPHIASAWEKLADAAGLNVAAQTGGLGSVASSTAAGDSPSANFAFPSLSDSLSRVGAYFATRGGTAWWFVMLIPPIVVGLLVPALDNAFGALAEKVNLWENHATESQHRNHRVAKVFLWRFVTAFISLYYYAFSPNHTLFQLAVQQCAFLVAGQLLGATRGLLIPAIIRGCRECSFRWRLRTAEETGVGEGRRGRRLMRHAKMSAWTESRLLQYDTFLSYARVLIQFGYVTFFSWTFPLAPALALCYNLLLMRMEATQLCWHTQRPIAHKAGGIGVWANVLEAMVLLAVLTNCAHQALASSEFASYFPTLNGGQKVLLVFVVEHAVLGLRLLLSHCVPPVPASVRRRMARDALALARLHGRHSVGSSGVLSKVGNAVPASQTPLPRPGSKGEARPPEGFLRRISHSLRSLISRTAGLSSRVGSNVDINDRDYNDVHPKGMAVNVVHSAQGVYVVGDLGNLRNAPSKTPTKH